MEKPSWNLYSQSPVVVNAPTGENYLASCVFEMQDGHAVWVRDDWFDTTMNPFHRTIMPPVFGEPFGTWLAEDTEFLLVCDGAFGKFTAQEVLRLFHERPIVERLKARGTTEREALRPLVEHEFGKVMR